VRANGLYNTLTRADDITFEPKPYLAEFMEPAPDLSYWTVRVRPAEFHNGKPVTADDVIYTFQRILNPKNGSSDAGILTSIDPKRMQKLDSRTVRLHLRFPDISLPGVVRISGCSIVPVGFDPKNPIGSGPFKFKNFTPGQQSTFVRNENYWDSGKPYLDELQVIDFADPGTTRVNALLSGQIDGADHILVSLAPSVEGSSGHQLLVSRSYAYETWEMRMDVAPFSDVRVRQAIKLIAGRPQIIEQAFSGSRYASLANDLPAFQDPLYDHSIPQRVQDIEQAKSLLKQAGQAGATVTLTVSDLSQGAVQTAQILAQQATAAGLTIKINNIADGATYFSKYWVQAPFKFDYWPTTTMWEHIGFSLLPGASANLTAWNDPHWHALVTQARGTADLAKRKEIMAEAQRILWDTGTQAIFAFYNGVDAYSTKFAGIKPSITGIGPSGLYFDNVGLA
jgi:peptide/nickel transport system substrate-binding protein